MNSLYFVDLAFPKLASAGLSSWSQDEQAAIDSLLWTRWQVGLAQKSHGVLSKQPVFNAGQWREVAPLERPGLRGYASPRWPAWKDARVQISVGHVARLNWR